MSQQRSSKEKVLEAASALFYQRGFNGTSVRDIAEDADVNVSLISYYFKNKQGLFEHAVTTYYESYLDTIEETLDRIVDRNPVDQLKYIVTVIIQYKQANHQLSCLVHRELSIDSTFVREMAVTYLAKENYYINELFMNALGERLQNRYDQKFLYMQLKGMLTTPYILQHEWKKQAADPYSDQLFAERYARTIHNWIDHLTQYQAVSNQIESES